MRSESSASSQIENLTSNVRNVALAELEGDAPNNALLIAGNVAAMRAALNVPADCTVDSLKKVHKALIEPSGQSYGGELRDEQVWIGGCHIAHTGPSTLRRDGRECLNFSMTFALFAVAMTSAR